MERIKLKLPDKFSFSTIIKIRITDLNYGGHVGNDSFLTLIHEARQQYLNYYNYSELDLEKTSLIMSDAAIEFKKELNYGNEVKISVAAAGFDKYMFDVFYKLEIVDGEKLILAGTAKTGMLCYDYQNKKIVAVPENAKNKLNT